MPKFKAPAHSSGIHLSSGPLMVVDGEVEIAEPTASDIAGLQANGFTLIAEGAYFAPPAPEPEPDVLAKIEAPAAVAEVPPAAEQDHPAE